MLKATALARLRINCQAASAPVLSDPELDDLLAYYALADSSGLPPDDPAWVGTWDLQAAYRKGWLVKAGKVVDEVNYSVDGAQYSTSDMHAHCMSMAQSFGSLGNLSIGQTDATDS